MSGKRKVIIERNPSFGQQRNYGLDTSWFPYGSSQDDKYNNSMSTLPEVPEQYANAELERGEVVMSSDQQGQPMQYKVDGDRHYAGGTPTILQQGDFVFSDTKKMKIKDKDLLNYFGKGGKAQTPAKIAKGYNIKPYQNTLQNPDADDIEKQTAQMMIDSYMSKLNDLAYVQEAQKDFPQGVPSLSDGVMKMGGKYKCQYGGIPEYQSGGGYTYPGYQNYQGIGPMPERQPLSITPQYYPWRMMPTNLDGNVPRDFVGTLPYEWKEGDPVTITSYDYGTPEENVLPDSKSAKLKDPLPTPQPQVNSDIPPTTQVIPGGQQPLNDLHPGVAYAKQGKKPPFQYTGADSMALANAFAQLGSAKKYLPWEAAPELQAPQYSQYSPEREIAASAETVNTLANAAALTGNPQLNRALYSQMQGQQAGNVANILGKYNNLNIEQSNRQADVDTQTRNQNAMMRAERANRLFDKTTVANQQYDNTLRQLQNNYVGANINAWNNRMNLYNMNVENPQYYIDPLSGKVVFKGNQTAMTSAGSGASSDDMLQLFQKYKEKYPNASDSAIEKAVMAELQQGQITTNQRNIRTRGYGNLNNVSYQGINPYQ